MRGTTLYDGTSLPEGWEQGVSPLQVAHPAEWWVSETYLEGQKCAEMSLEDKCCGQQHGGSLCPCCNGLGRAVAELHCLHATIISACMENPSRISSLTTKCLEDAFLVHLYF